jgi:predicted transposase YbfD/YdcC
MKKIILSEALEGIEDTRRSRSVIYPLVEILMITLLGVMCGATSYIKIEMFGKSKEEWMKRFLKLEYGIPDACTIRDVIKEIDTAQLHEIFVEWMKNIAREIFGVVAIDGKEARRTKDKNTKPLHVVSAFSHAYGVVLGQLACEEKSNEITAIPKLLEMLEVKGCIVTIDAMGCQKDIADKIIEKGADYCLSLKENQGNLYNDVKLYMENEIFTANRKELSESGQYYRNIGKKGQGRIEKREYFICNDVSWLYNANEWRNLSGFGVCVSTVEQDGKITVSHNYAIYSVPDMTADNFAKCKRAHWSIENSLHWVLDMVFREDESRARADNSAENLNVFRQMAFNILKCETSFKGGISDKQFNCLLDERYLEKVVRAWICS